MTCMCGDYCCPSCGFAQGNWKCPICNEWASEGCEHIDEDTGDLKREFVNQAQEIEEMVRLQEEEMYQQLQEEEAKYREYMEGDSW